MEKRPPFSSLPLSADLLQVIADLGLTTLTQIQEESIPPLLAGKDLVGQSKTGSGKTFAFGIPMIEKIDLSAPRLQALVLCPTRELCTQVAREIRKLGRRHPSMKVVALVGGEPIRNQLVSLERGAHIAVGTPGRILDHLRRGSLNFDSTNYIVLDEADRMLDMGFQEEMEEILAALPEQRQTLFFSATFPDSIEAMSERYQKKPIFVKVENTEEAQVSIEQTFYSCEADDKYSLLLWLLTQNQPESTIVFCNLKVTVAELAESLEAEGVSAAALHGDLEQQDRDRVMAIFRNGSVRVLVATDVAARGIDVADLDMVVNFDVPKPDIYVHRIGRTGRAGKSGLAVTFMEDKEKYKLKGISEACGKDLKTESLPDLSELSDSIEFPARMATLYISAGRKDKMRPGDILGALTGEAGFAAKDIGKIEILDRFSFVAVSTEILQEALKKLQNGKIKGRKLRVELMRLN